MVMTKLIPTIVINNPFNPLKLYENDCRRLLGGNFSKKTPRVCDMGKYATHHDQVGIRCQISTPELRKKVATWCLKNWIKPHSLYTLVSQGSHKLTLPTSDISDAGWTLQDWQDSIKEIVKRWN